MKLLQVQFIKCLISNIQTNNSWNTAAAYYGMPAIQTVISSCEQIDFFIQYTFKKFRESRWYVTLIGFAYTAYTLGAKYVLQGFMNA